MKTKRIAAVLLTLFAMLTVASCGGNGEPADTGNTSVTETPETEGGRYDISGIPATVTGEKQNVGKTSASAADSDRLPALRANLFGASPASIPISFVLNGTCYRGLDGFDVTRDYGILTAVMKDRLEIKIVYSEETDTAAMTYSLKFTDLSGKGAVISDVRFPDALQFSSTDNSLSWFTGGEDGVYRVKLPQRPGMKLTFSDGGKVLPFFAVDDGKSGVLFACPVDGWKATVATVYVSSGNGSAPTVRTEFGLEIASGDITVAPGESVVTETITAITYAGLSDSDYPAGLFAAWAEKHPESRLSSSPFTGK